MQKVSSGSEKLVQQVQGIKNLIKFKQALLQLTQDEIKQCEQDIIFLQGKAEEEAENHSQDEIQRKSEVQK